MTTREVLQELVQSLALWLRRALSPRAQKAPSAEVLSVARMFIRDMGAGRVRTDAKARARLEALHAVYVKRLSEAVSAETPSAAVLSEVRQFLKESGVVKDLGGHMRTREALALLADSSVPFTKH